MNLKTAVASALLGTLVTGGASAGVINTLSKRDNPVITFDASAPPLGAPMPAPVPDLSVAAQTPAGTVGVSTEGGEVALTAPVPVPGGITGTASVAVTTSTAPQSTPAASGVLTLPGLDVAGLGDVLRTLSALDVARVAALLQALPEAVYPILGQVLSLTPAGDMDELVALLRAVDPAQAARIAGVLGNVAPGALTVVGEAMKTLTVGQLGQIAGVVGKLPVSAQPVLTSLLSTLNGAQLNAVTGLFLNTPAGQMSAAGNALVNPNLLGGLLNGVLSTLSGTTRGLITQLTSVVPSQQTVTLVGQLMTMLEPATVTGLGTALDLIPDEQMALVNRLVGMVPVDDLALVSEMVESLGVTGMPVVGDAFFALSSSALEPLAALLGFVPRGVPLPVVADLFDAL